MQVWAEDEEIICVHPAGLRLIGLHAIKDSWQEILTQGALHIRPEKLVTTQSMMSTVHSLIEEVTVRGQGRTEVAHCYATNVYHKGPTGWRMVMHHASAAPEQSGMLERHETSGLLH